MKYLANLIIQKKLVLVILFLSIISRYFTTIFYIEDIDSLRFFLSAYDYNVIEGRPHFPGYPFYCFFLKVIYYLSGSIEYSFSFIGALSVFLIVYYSNKLSYLFYQKNNYILILLLIFNPLLWLMSNRYMPDILGLSFLLSATFYYINFLKNKDPRNIIYLALSIGILVGVRISYIPFLIPIIYLLKFDYKSFIKLTLLSIIISLFWFIPWVYITGFNEIYYLAIHDVNGHFFEWGGTINSGSSSLKHRLIMIFKSIFADGLGFWWNDRHYSTLINLVFLAPFLFLGIIFMCKDLKKNFRFFFVILMCIVIYFFWILLYQNVVYKPRHVLPLIPFFLFIMSHGFIFFINKFKRFKYFFLIFFVPYFYVSIIINNQHQNIKSSLSQMHDYIQNIENKSLIIISDNLKINYFKRNFYNYNDRRFKKIKYLTLNKFNNEKFMCNKGDCIIFSTSELLSSDLLLVNEKHFFHNPYVNRLWDHLTIYEYEKK